MKTEELTILACDNRVAKSGRDRASGVMRYAAARPNWRLHFMRRDEILHVLEDPGADVDGVIFNAAPESAPAAVARRLRRIPCVFIHTRFAELGGMPPYVRACVETDNAAIARAAARLLVSRHAEHFAYVGGASAMSSLDLMHSAARERAMRSFLRARRRPFSAFRQSGEAWTALHALAEWLAALPKPCGVMAYNDETAHVVLDACRLAHLLVPEQALIVGVDDDVSVCETLRPTLSSVLPDFEQSGFLAAQLLDRILRRGFPARPLCRRYGVRHVTERASTQDAKGGGRLVAAAREIVRTSASAPSVDEIARALNVSRRLLELRFAEVMGWGVAAEIRRVRLARVCAKLRESDATIQSISAELGFDNAAHLKVLFKKTYGMTMGEWRRRGR